MLTKTYYGNFIPRLPILDSFLFPHSLSLQRISVVLSYIGYIHIFTEGDINLLHGIEVLLTTSVILSIIGIIRFVKCIFAKNKRIERKIQENL